MEDFSLVTPRPYSPEPANPNAKGNRVRIARCVQRGRGEGATAQARGLERVLTALER